MDSQEHAAKTGGGQEQEQHDHRHHIAHHHAVEPGTAEVFAVLLHLIDDSFGPDDPADEDAGQQADKGHQEAVADVVPHVRSWAVLPLGRGSSK